MPLLASRIVRVEHHVAAQAIVCSACGVGPGHRCQGAGVKGNTGHIIRVHEHRANTAPLPTPVDMTTVFGVGLAACTLCTVLQHIRDHGESLLFTVTRHSDAIYTLTKATARPWGSIRADVIMHAVTFGILIANGHGRRQGYKATPRALTLAALPRESLVERSALTS